MKNDVSIVDLAGALTLPLISELLAAYNLIELNALFHRLDLLHENNCHSLAFDIIYDLFRKTRLEIPYVFYEMIEFIKNTPDVTTIAIINISNIIKIESNENIVSCIKLYYIVNIFRCVCVQSERSLFPLFLAKILIFLLMASVIP